MREAVHARVGDEKRFLHILGVEQECERLADIFGFDKADKEKLIAAGLLHDLTKNMDASEQAELLKEAGEAFTEETLLCPKTMHQQSGAILARKLCPDAVDDKVYCAIRFHTTGRADMTLFEKLVYLADFIEIHRPYEECKYLRSRFYDHVATADDKMKELDLLLLESFDITLRQILQEGKYMHSETVKARNYLLLSTKNINGKGTIA